MRHKYLSQMFDYSRPPYNYVQLFYCQYIIFYVGLSERRVQDVAQYLVNNGVDANRLIGIANGDAKPVATNATANGKAENRRVDVFIHR